jgi:hypothetical protein
MIIRTAENNILVGFSYLNNYPDPFVSEEKKLTDESYIKNTMDYFTNMALTQYWKNRDTIAPNYNLLKGIITRKDFYQEEPEVKDFLQTLVDSEKLPSYVKHYSLINQPVNALVGELIKRPDQRRVRAYDDDSRSEELEYKTELVQKLILQNARNIVINKLAIKGVDITSISQDDLETMTMESVQDMLTEYTSLAERWGNHIVTALKATFNMKGKSEDAFRDMLICAREFFHIYADNSKLGFNVRVENPKNVWWKATPDIKYTSGASNDGNVAYCAGTIYVKEISELIDEVPELTIEEIEHLKKGVQNSLLLSGRESNLFSGQEGINSIHYDTYNPLIWQERMFLESQIGSENQDDLNRFLGGSNQFSFGYKYTVVKAYWNSKKKVGQLTYIDEKGETATTLVDESYKEGSPGEISIEWGWVNQWYEGIKIGPDIYHVKPFKLLDYCPIIGMIFEQKNTEPRSLVDLMKPLQVLFNVVMNQLYEILEKEIGMVGVVNIRRIPKPKDGDAADAIDVWEQEARDRGIIFDDDSPENTKGQTSNTTVAKNIDLTRTNELQSRLSLATQLQEMAWQLIGMNRQRLGSPLATETATANQNALVQSFAQTEPYFAAHDYLMNQLYQSMLDAAKYIEQNKPLSTVNYISDQGENVFIQVMGSDLSFRDLRVLMTSSPEDQQLYNEFKQLAQAALQNGASLYEVSGLFTSNSLREYRRMFKELKKRQEEMQQQEQQIKQQELEQQQKQHQETLQQEDKFHEDDIAIKKYEIDVKANTDITKAEISTYFQAPTTDADSNGVPDIMDIANHNLKLQESIRARDLENKNISLQFQKFQEEKKQNSITNKQTEKAQKQKDEEIKIKKKIANKPKPKS